MTTEYNPKTETRSRFLSHDAAAKEGYATFNKVPHVCVDVPDHNVTITCRTSDGRRVTFAFLQYQKDNPPQCVDIHYADGPKWKGSDGREREANNILLFSDGGKQKAEMSIGKPISIACLVMNPANTRPDHPCQGKQS